MSKDDEAKGFTERPKPLMNSYAQFDFFGSGNNHAEDSLTKEARKQRLDSGRMTTPSKLESILQDNDLGKNDYFTATYSEVEGVVRFGRRGAGAELRLTEEAAAMLKDIPGVKIIDTSLAEMDRQNEAAVAQSNADFNQRTTLEAQASLLSRSMKDISRRVASEQYAPEVLENAQLALAEINAKLNGELAFNTPDESGLFSKSGNSYSLNLSDQPPTRAELDIRMARLEQDQNPEIQLAAAPQEPKLESIITPTGMENVPASTAITPANINPETSRPPMMYASLPDESGQNLGPVSMQERQEMALLIATNRENAIVANAVEEVAGADKSNGNKRVDAKEETAVLSKLLGGDASPTIMEELAGLREAMQKAGVMPANPNASNYVAGNKPERSQSLGV